MSIGYSNSEQAHSTDSDLIESCVWIALTLSGIGFLFYQCQEYVEYLIAPAAIVLPGVIIWRITSFYRTRAHFKKLKSKMKKTMNKYSQAKRTTEELPPGDREMAARELEEIKKTGWSLCKELSTFRAELRVSKQSVMTKLGEISSDELAKKLAPIRVLEVEVDQLLNEFEPIANPRRDRER